MPPLSIGYEIERHIRLIPVPLRGSGYIRYRRVIPMPDINTTGTYLCPSLFCLHPHLSAMKKNLVGYFAMVDEAACQQ
jgi:hypothetical protein